MNTDIRRFTITAKRTGSGKWASKATVISKLEDGRTAVTNHAWIGNGNGFEEFIAALPTIIQAVLEIPQLTKE